MALMFLNGDGMRGGRAHYTIEGVPLVGERRTAPLYRFFSVRDEFPALELSIIELEDGELSFAMVLRESEHALGIHTDITGHGGWRAYRAASLSEAPEP
jgi:hypothetical protein